MMMRSKNPDRGGEAVILNIDRVRMPCLGKVCVPDALLGLLTTRASTHVGSGESGSKPGSWEAGVRAAGSQQRHLRVPAVPAVHMWMVPTAVDWDMSCSGGAELFLVLGSVVINTCQDTVG